jgi:DNA-binding GntR family transcriptional regulator
MKKISNPHGKTVLTEPIYEAIKARIMEQEFPPESRLNIDALSTELKVSPTPIREALARLAAERLVIFEPYKGYAVSPPLTPSELDDLIHVRSLIETDAVRLAAVRIKRHDLLALEKLLAELAAIPWPSASFQAYQQSNQLDKRFHEIMIRAADNRFLLETYSSLNAHVQLARFYRQYGAIAHQDTYEEHKAIYKALEAHDPSAAVQAMERHLSAAEARAYGLMDTHSMP